jgi:hypothetical protein
MVALHAAKDIYGEKLTGTHISKVCLAFLLGKKVALFMQIAQQNLVQVLNVSGLPVTTYQCGFVQI